MDPIDICPPHWPWIIWWHVHHPPGDPPPIDTQFIKRLDAQFAAIAVAGLAGRLADQRVAGEIAKAVGPLATGAMPSFR